MAACIDMSGKRKTFEKNIWSTSPAANQIAQGCVMPNTPLERQESETELIKDSFDMRKAKGQAEPDTSISSEESGAILVALPKSLAKTLPRLYKTELIPVDLRFNVVREESYRMNLARANKKVIREAIVRNAPKAQASICFVVKRPGMYIKVWESFWRSWNPLVSPTSFLGCVLCHEQGNSLSQLVSEFQDNQVAAWAVIKEVDVDNEGLLTLYQRYFSFPFFRDPKLALYNALGEGKVGIILNPFRMVTRYNEIRKRLKEKNIEGNMLGKGEGMILGGVIVFDRRGKIRYAHQEAFTRELPVDEIRAALRRVVEEDNERRREGSDYSSEPSVK
jgi:peroxiredoxin